MHNQQNQPLCPSNAVTLNDLQKLRILGQGTYGKCYLVQNKLLNQLCVLKQIQIYGMSQQQQQQVLKQAKILSVLDNPYIVKFLTFFKNDSYFNIVMEYADGGDLNKYIKEAKGNHFPEGQILNWFTQICIAIKHIHDRKVVHRDLKCQNIFMTKEGFIKLGDFGIAKHLSKTLEKIKTVVGTPYYMSPEICQNKDYSFKTDIWSLGVILYQMCALKLPFDGSSLPVLALKISRGQYPAITANYSKQLKSLIKSLLQNNPSKRPTINKILQNPLISKRLSAHLSKHMLIKQFSLPIPIQIQIQNDRNMLQKENDQENFQESLKDNRSQLQADKKIQVHSARNHQFNNKQGKIYQGKNVQSVNRLKQFGVNSKSGKVQKDKKKKVQSFKRRQISQPNLAIKKYAIKSNQALSQPFPFSQPEPKSQVLPPFQQVKQQQQEHTDQIVQSLCQTLRYLIQQKQKQKQKYKKYDIKMKYLEMADCYGLTGNSFENNGLLSLLWGVENFGELDGDQQDCVSNDANGNGGWD